MPQIDLSYIHYRAYLPQWDSELSDEEYDPVGPDDADINEGIDLAPIKYRAWQQNDLE